VSERASLGQHRGFQLLWIGQTLSSLGDSFTAVAFPLLVFRTTGSIAKMTTITACFAGGTIAAGFLSGRLVDYFDRQRLMITTDGARALLMASIPVATRFDLISVPLLGAVALCMGVLGNLFGVAYVAFIPELVSKARVTEANARLQGSAAICFVAGPALAGLAAERWGPALAIGVDALSFMASLTLLSLVRRPRTVPVAVSTARGGRLAGASFILRTPVLRSLTLLYVVEMLATAATLDLFTFHLKVSLGQSDARVGVMFAVASVGAVLGSLSAARAKRRLGMQRIYMLGSCILSFVLALAPHAGTFVLTAATAVAYMFITTLRSVLSMSVRQEVTPDAVLGRVTAVFWLVLAAMRVVGASVVGRIASAYGTNIAFKFIAAVLLLHAILTIPMRSLRKLGS